MRDAKWCGTRSDLISVLDFIILFYFFVSVDVERLYIQIYNRLC